MYDAIIIGSGPNGLSAGIALAQKGLSVKIFETSDVIGGGARTKELTLPGFHHDVCSAIHPMAVGSPFLKTLPLEDFGLKWIYPEYPLAHPLDNEPAVILRRSLDDTAKELGKDEKAYKNLFIPFVKRWEELAPEILSPFNSIPSSPVLMAQFGLKSLRSACSLANNQFQTERAKALFAGLAAHSLLSLDEISTAAIALVLGSIGHVKGWPMPRGGSQELSSAMGKYFKNSGGEIETNAHISELRQLPKSKVVLFNNTPQQIIEIAKNKLPPAYTKKLKKYKYGAGVFKMDIALDGPVPWNDPQIAEAGTVHLGGSLKEIARSEQMIANNNHPEKPYILLAQQSMFDDTRAPEGKHTVWAYCHVPNDSTKDMSEPILAQIERFAPGFRDLILAKHTMNTHELHTYNPNYIGGDINGGSQNITQLFTRPVGLFDPYHIPDTNLYIASASTPPGGGVHGMCGYHAAQSVLKHLAMV